MTYGTIYYVQNASGETFQLSTDAEGANIIAMDNLNTAFIFNMADHGAYAQVGASGSSMPGSTSYGAIGMHALELAWANEHPDLDQATYVAARAWFSPIAYGGTAQPLTFAADATTIRNLE